MDAKTVIDRYTVEETRILVVPPSMRSNAVLSLLYSEGWQWCKVQERKRKEGA